MTRKPVLSIDPTEDPDKSTHGEGLYEVRMINNDYNTYEEVMTVTMMTLNISEEQAYSIAWEIDHLGSCVVAHAPLETAERLACLIRTIGIEVQVNPVGLELT